jgi:ribose transport system permease protein
MWIVSPTFRLPFNQISILRQMTIVAVLAIGQTLAIVSGAFDLSQGAIAAMVGMLAGTAIKSWGWPPLAGVAFGLAMGVASGFFNALIITGLRFEPVVATLASSSIFAGMMYGITKGLSVVDLPPAFTWLGSGDLGPLPVAVIVMFLLYLVMHFVLTNSVLGRHIFLVGSNKEAARLAGISVERTQFTIFIISGFLSGLAGIMLVGRISAALPSMAVNLMMPTVAAAIVGGTWLSGGVGSMAGTLMGAAIMAIIRNAVVVLKVDIYLQDFVIGVATLLAVVMDLFRRGALSLDLLRGKGAE